MNKTELTLYLCLFILFLSPLYGENKQDKILLFYNMEPNTTLIYEEQINNVVICGTSKERREVRVNTINHKKCQITNKYPNGNIDLSAWTEIKECVINGVESSFHGCPAIIHQTCKKNGETIFNNYDFEENFSKLVFPERPIGIGDNWSIIPNNKNKPFVMKYNFVFAGYVKYNGYDCVKINFDGIINPQYKGNTANSLHTEATGKIFFDYKRGIILFYDALIYMISKLKNSIKDEEYTTESTTKYVGYLSEIKIDKK